jgi:poly-gamma-glutamate synthesis protein (capsule biosynthesis protein)
MMKRVGLITAFTVTKEINSGETKITIDDVKADLLYTYHNNYKNFKVIPFSHLTDSELKNHEQIYNEYMKYVNPTGLDTIQMGFIE